MKARLKPFANETDVLTIGNLAIETRTDRMSIGGALDITRDQEGLANARALIAELQAIVTALEAENLPPKIAGAEEVLGSNPFGPRN